MKKSVMKGMVAGLALAASAPVFAGQSANVAVTSDYIWRGVTQTANGAAVQGGYDYDAENGFALGIWGSSLVDGIEYDLYGSYSGASGDFGYEVGYIYYGFTATGATSASEPYVGLSFKDVSLGYYLGDGYNYMELGYSTDISGVGLGLTYGSNSFTVGSLSDSNYTLSVSKDFSGYNVGLTYASYTDVASTSTTATALMVSKEFDL